MDTPFYRSHAKMRLQIYSDLQGTDAVAFPLEGGVAAVLDVTRLNKRFGDKSLVEHRVLEMMRVYRKHPQAFQPFLMVDKNGKPTLYQIGSSGRWEPSARTAEITKAAETGERL
jgi:hypothetical protein